MVTGDNGGALGPERYRQGILVLCGIVAIAAMGANEGEQVIRPELHLCRQRRAFCAQFVIHGVQRNQCLPGTRQ